MPKDSPRSPRRSRRAALALTVAMVMVLLGGVLLWRYIAFSLWVEEDAEQLVSYPDILLNIPAASAEAPTSATLMARMEPMDRAVLEANSSGRLLVHLSRSPYRAGPLGRQHFVKVYLETRLPESQAVTPLKVLNVLEERDGMWKVVEMRDLTMP